MWDNKKKAVTFSYDDGVMQDRRLVEFFNNYNLKCTFNINSGMLYNECIWNCKDVDVIRMTAEQCIQTYKGHEVAVHTLTHPVLSTENQNQCYQTRRQIIGDKINIERIFDTQIYGMAYPGGIYDKGVIEIIKESGLKYSRTVNESGVFAIPENLLELSGTAKHTNENLMKLANEFVSLKSEQYKLFYIWGHSYEFDCDNNWNVIEELCSFISGKDDIFYGTNHQILSPFYR